MVQGRESLRFPLESGHPFRLRGERIGQALDRDLAAKRGIRRSVHLAHAAFAKGGDDFVDADSGAGSQRQAAELYGEGPLLADYSCNTP
jgi:hypothetical protein